jgi:hypothetical protein
MTASSSSSEAARAAAASLSEALNELRSTAAACLDTEGAPAAAEAAIDELLLVAVRLKVASLSASTGPQISDLRTPLTATEVAVLCTHLLNEAELDVFELAMWRTWGRP